MPTFKTTKRNIVLRALKSFGFTLEGNYGRHGTHIVRGNQSVSFPTYQEFDVKFLHKLLKETGITQKDEQYSSQQSTRHATRIKTTQAVVGEANVDPNRQPSMGGEDFAFMLLERPGAFMFFGVNDDEIKRRELHSPTYDFNDKAIPFGVAYRITLMQQELND